jgi:hypothetical protein
MSSNVGHTLARDVLFPGRDPDRPQLVSALVERINRRWRDAGSGPARVPRGPAHRGEHLHRRRTERQGGEHVPRHANIAVTFDRYGHLFPGAQREARGLLDAYLADL